VWGTDERSPAISYGSKSKNKPVVALRSTAGKGWTSAAALDPPTAIHFDAARSLWRGFSAFGISNCGSFRVLAAKLSKPRPPNSIAAVPALKKAENDLLSREAIHDSEVRNSHSSIRTFWTGSSMVSFCKPSKRGVLTLCSSDGCYASNRIVEATRRRSRIAEGSGTLVNAPEYLRTASGK